MTGREKIEAAFSPGGTPEIPAVICYEEIFIRDHWSGITDAPWWHMWVQDVEQQAAWRSAYVRKVRPDWHVVYGIAPRGERENQRIEERPDGVFRVDQATGERRKLTRFEVGGWAPEKGLHSHHPEKPPRTREEVDRVLPLPEEFDADRYAAEGRADLARELCRRLGTELFPFSHVSSPSWDGYGIWGFEGWMLMIAERPDLVRYAAERSLEVARRRVHEYAGLGLRGVFIEECMTDMMSPEAFRELDLPFVRALTDEIRAAGMKSIYYYCGSPAGKWRYILDTGADALSLEESKKGFEIDIEDVVDRVGGRFTVLGNLDAIHLLPNATEEQLRSEISRQIAAGRRNRSRFIMSIGSPVTPGTPVERVRLYGDLTRELGSR